MCVNVCIWECVCVGICVNVCECVRMRVCLCLYLYLCVFVRENKGEKKLERMLGCSLFGCQDTKH